jgi:hypothetical protein
VFGAPFVSGPKNKDKHDLQSPTYRHVTNVTRIRPSQAYHFPRAFCLALENLVKRYTSVVDGHEAAVGVAYRLSEVIAIYPITPSSRMGEWSDQ